MEEERVVVECDSECGAFLEPKTFKEFKKALEHWRYHSCNSGCSHGD